MAVTETETITSYTKQYFIAVVILHKSQTVNRESVLSLPWEITQIGYSVNQ